MENTFSNFKDKGNFKEMTDKTREIVDHLVNKRREIVNHLHEASSITEWMFRHPSYTQLLRGLRNQGE